MQTEISSNFEMTETTDSKGLTLSRLLIDVEEATADVDDNRGRGFAIGD
jgi:hypothetical protein